MLIDTFFSVGAIPKGNAYFRQGSGRIWLDDLNCNGSETDIAFCGHRGWGRTNCDHSEDASVICNGKFSCFYFQKFRYIMTLIVRKKLFMRFATQ